MAADQQMVWRVHKELSGRKRTSYEDQDYGSLSPMDHDRAFIILDTRTCPTTTTCSANTGSNGNRSNSGEHLHHKITHFHEEIFS